MLREEIKKDINNSLKEIQENTGKQVEACKEKTQWSMCPYCMLGNPLGI